MKLKFSSLKHDNGRRYWMLSLLTKQRDIHFAFVPSLWREFYFDKEGRQFLDNDIRYCWALGIFQIIIHDYTGTKWIHLIVDEKRTYHPISRKEEIDHFKNCLKIFSSNIDRDLILRIKKGELSYNEIMDIVNKKKDEMNQCQNVSTLRETVDVDYLNKWLLDVRHKQLNGEL